MFNHSSMAGMLPPPPVQILAAAAAGSPEMRSLRFDAPLDFGVVKPSGRRALDDDFANEVLGRDEATRLNFVSMMMEGLSMEFLSEWMSRVKAARIREYRVYTREMESIMGRYAYTARSFWGEKMPVYRYFFDEALKESAREQRVFRDMGMSNEVARQIPATKDRDAALMLCFTIEMIRRAREVDEEKAERLSRALGGARVTCDRDPHLTAMILVCRRMQRNLGLEVEVTHAIRSVIESFHSRMSAWCLQILSEDSGALDRTA